MDAAIITETKKLLGELKAAIPGRQRVLIMPHDYPDPDALASAAALHLLLDKRWNIHSQIMFSGIVSRAENRELLRHLKYKWIAPSQWKGGPRKHPAIFIDTTPWMGNVTIPSFARPIGVFDHHPRLRRKIPPLLFADISPNIGAISSRMFEMLTVAGIPIPKWLATLMAYAIATETLDFIRHSSGRDIEAYTALLANSNLKTLGIIKNAALPRAYYGFLVEAVNHALTYGRVAWTHLAAVSQPELVAEIADLLLRMERVTWAFCTAFTEDRLIVSLRSEMEHVQCGRLLRKVIGKHEGTAGGHGQSAAGYILLEGLSETEKAQRRETLTNRLVAAIEGRTSETATPLLDQTKNGI